MSKPGGMFLIAEYCAGPFYMGWHLYLRDSMGRQQRNADGEWGWIQYGPSQQRWDVINGTRLHPARAVFDALGITDTIIGGCGDKGAIARFAFSHKIPRQRIAKKPRGCVPVMVDEYGMISLAAT